MTDPFGGAGALREDHVAVDWSATPWGAPDTWSRRHGRAPTWRFHDGCRTVRKRCTGHCSSPGGRRSGRSGGTDLHEWHPTDDEG